LLCVCICQGVLTFYAHYLTTLICLEENDTLARIGTSCVQSSAGQDQITTTFARLFRTTTPFQLFDESFRVEIDASTDAIEADTGNCFISPPANLPDMLLEPAVFFFYQRHCPLLSTSTSPVHGRRSVIVGRFSSRYPVKVCSNCCLSKPQTTFCETTISIIHSYCT